MDANLATESRNVNPYAENISAHHLASVIPAVYKLPGKLTHDGYPNLTVFELDQVPNRLLDWFINQVGQTIFAASQKGENGQLKITDAEQAYKLYERQALGYKFLTLVQRLRFNAYPSSEPRPGHFYTFNRYLNGELQERLGVTYLGLSENMKWYIFQFIDGPDEHGFPHHLLPVGEFPAYKKELAPGAIHFEQYTSILSIVK